MWTHWLGDVGALSLALLCVVALVGAAVGSVLPLSPTEPLLLVLPTDGGALTALAKPEAARGE